MPDRELACGCKVCGGRVTYVPWYDAFTEIKYGEMPTAAAIQARQQLMREAGQLVTLRWLNPLKLVDGHYKYR